MIAREVLVVQARELQSKLRKLAHRLKESFDICRAIDLQQPSDADLRELEALSARFERALDILVRSYFRILDRIEETAEGTVIDALNRAEKRGLIDSATEFRRFRVMRNEIAHEYLDDEAAHIASLILKATPTLLDSLKRSANYPIHVA